jgi:hypothetical protein
MKYFALKFKKIIRQMGLGKCGSNGWSGPVGAAIQAGAPVQFTACAMKKIYV